MVFMWDPLSWVMEGASLAAIALLRNYKTSSARIDSLAPKTKAERAGQWKEIESADLVPDDMVSFKSGDIIPADCSLTESINVSLDLAALTGESLPQKADDQCFSWEGLRASSSPPVSIRSSVALRRSLVRTATSPVTSRRFAQIGSFCLISSGIFVIAGIFCVYAGFHYNYCHGLYGILVHLNGGIPIAVLSVTLALSSLRSTRPSALVSMSLRSSPLHSVFRQTGTLKINTLNIGRETIHPFSVEDVILCAACASRTRALSTLASSPLSPTSLARALVSSCSTSSPSSHGHTYREESTGRLKRVIKGMYDQYHDRALHEP
ncbi:E1-E2 ATPase-domain-containing protein [Fomitopsis serialis]|uniref:E1-E2 ATPase-domain-containing protein n=1 Tax=Fomitopsis serialis TaxID=139415 RepID=UPI0020084D9D|nr:E1-E2 ATPase-domain-containing protein [Neoantrodia serialis]KAH9923077.1 E1-E2 ATPase-domain-containing protein [Neoantrodia serialis]